MVGAGASSGGSNPNNDHYQFVTIITRSLRSLPVRNDHYPFVTSCCHNFDSINGQQRSAIPREGQQEQSLGRYSTIVESYSFDLFLKFFSISWRAASRLGTRRSTRFLFVGIILFPHDRSCSCLPFSTRQRERASNTIEGKVNHHFHAHTDTARSTTTR